MKKNIILSMLFLAGFATTLQSKAKLLPSDTQEEIVATQADISNWLNAHDPKTYPHDYMLFKMKDSGKTAVYYKSVANLKGERFWRRYDQPYLSPALRGILIPNDL